MKEHLWQKPDPASGGPRRLHRIAELNTAAYPLDSAAGEEAGSSLAFNARESFVLSGEKGWYPRVKRLRDGSFILFYQDRPRMNNYYRTSRDGVIWGPPVKLFAQKRIEINGEADERGYMSPDACQLSDGRLVCVSSYRANLHYRSAIGENGVVARFSEDNGKTWGEERTVYVGTNWEPYVMEADNGDIYVFVTVTAPSIYEIGVGQFEYRSSGVALLRSADGGKSWQPKVSGPPYIPQYVMRQYIYTAENGIDRYNDQMPVALRLHDGTIALSAETWHQDKDEYWFSICYNRDGFSEDLGMRRSGPASRSGDLFRAAAPYTAQFESDEVVVAYNGKESSYYRLADHKAREFYDSHVVFAKSGPFGSVEKVSSHSAILAIETPDFELCGKRAYLNHRLHAGRMTPSLIGDTSQWDANTDALFCGALTQAQVSVRVAYDDENVYLLAERLDDSVTAQDAVIVYLDDGEDGCYAVTLNHQGIAEVSYVGPDEASEPVDAAACGIRAAVRMVDAASGRDGGVIYELAVPRVVLHAAESVRLLFDLINADEPDGEATVERVKPEASLTEKEKWFTAEFGG